MPSQPQSSETNGRLAGSSLERAIEETAVRSGDIVNGKYRVERVLGVGGMGVVFRVTQIELDRPVALKVLASKVKHHKGAIERFTREARAAARIRSEHVGNILDVDKLPSGEPFIVMELLEGADLADLLAKRGALSIEVAAGYVMQACDGLRAAHAAGIVHRDLKPANLFLARVDEEKSVIKLLDFGISKLTQDETVALTSASEVMGSPLYMSPEQMQASRDVDARTDIWSLGVVLYELATARVPFDGKTTPMVAAAVLGKPPEPLGLPGERGVALEAIIVRCLQKNPEDRFGSARELANALRPLSGAMNPPSHAPVERSLDGTASLGEERAGPLPMQSATGVELRESSTSAVELRAIPSKRRTLIHLAAALVIGLTTGAYAVLSRAEKPLEAARAAEAGAATLIPTAEEPQVVAPATMVASQATAMASVSSAGPRSEPARATSVWPSRTKVTGAVPSAAVPPSARKDDSEIFGPRD